MERTHPLEVPLRGGTLETAVDAVVQLQRSLGIRGDRDDEATAIDVGDASAHALVFGQELGIRSHQGRGVVLPAEQRQPRGGDCSEGQGDRQSQARALAEPVDAADEGVAEGALNPRGVSGRRQEGRDGEQCDGQGHGDADGPEAAHLFEAREVASRQGREGDRRGQAACQE